VCINSSLYNQRSTAYWNMEGPLAALVFHMKPLIFQATLSVLRSECGLGGHPPWLERGSLVPLPNLW
jgi:hypothetical protein